MVAWLFLRIIIISPYGAFPWYSHEEVVRRRENSHVSLGIFSQSLNNLVRNEATISVCVHKKCACEIKFRVFGYHHQQQR